MATCECVIQGAVKKSEVDQLMQMLKGICGTGIRGQKSHECTMIPVVCESDGKGEGGHNGKKGKKGDSDAMDVDAKSGLLGKGYGKWGEEEEEEEEKDKNPNEQRKNIQYPQVYDVHEIVFQSYCRSYSVRAIKTTVHDHRLDYEDDGPSSVVARMLEDEVIKEKKLEVQEELRNRRVDEWEVEDDEWEIIYYGQPQGANTDNSKHDCSVRSVWRSTLKGDALSFLTAMGFKFEYELFKESISFVYLRRMQIDISRVYKLPKMGDPSSRLRLFDEYNVELWTTCTPEMSGDAGKQLYQFASLLKPVVVLKKIPNATNMRR